MVVLNPDHGARGELGHDGLCERHVRLAVGKPVLVLEVHLSGVVVEERPENRVREAVVVTVRDIVVQVDGLARVLLLQTAVDDRSVLGRNEEAWPANPREGHGLFATRKRRDETAGRHLEVVLARGILVDGNGETV